MWGADPAPGGGRAGAPHDGEPPPRRRRCSAPAPAGSTGRSCSCAATSGHRRSSTSTSHDVEIDRELVPRRRDARVGEPPRGLPRRAGPRHARRAGRADPRAVVLRATRSARRRPGRGSRTPPPRRRSTTSRAQARADELRALAAGRIVTRAGTIDRWFEYAAPDRRRSPTDLDPAARGRRRRGRGRSSTRRPRHRLAPVRDRHGARPRAPRLRAVRAAAPARPAGRPARPRALERSDETAPRAPPSSTSSTPRDPDPWEFETSEYEAAKYDATIAALEGRRYATGLEIGCSIGVLTAAARPARRRPARDRRRRGRARRRPASASRA